MTDGKKLLLVAYYAPPAPVGAGVAMYHLISKLSPETFCILTEERSLEELASPHEHRLNAPYYYYNSSRINPISAAVSLDHATTNTRTPNLFTRFLLLCRKNPITRKIGQHGVVVRHISTIVKAGNRAIAKERPTMIVAYSDTGPGLIASYILSLWHRVPLTLYFYDLYKGNNLSLAQHTFAMLFEPLMLRRARSIFVMNDLLREVYESRSGQKKVTTIYNSLPEHEHRAGGPLVEVAPSIAYLGSIYWAQESALKDLIKAATLLKPIPKIVLYTPYEKEYLTRIGIYESDHLVFTTCRPEDAVKELEKYTLTFLGLSHTSPYQLLINTSSPVRLCDYLNAHVPMLIHAPADSFVVRHARTHDFGFVSTEPNPQMLATILKEGLSSDTRAQKVAQANLIGRTLHNPELSAQTFSNIIFSDTVTT